MLFLLLVLIHVVRGVLGQTPDPPDYSDDRFPPYPDPSDPNTANKRGTRLYGWDGCEAGDEMIIQEAYEDMHHIADYSGNTNVDWSAEGIENFFGPTTGPDVIDDETKREIQNILGQVQQMYAFVPLPPVPGLSNWIHVRCSGGDLTGDPDNVCGDLPKEDPDAPKCPDGSTPLIPPGDERNPRSQAYSDNLMPAEWDRITFCKEFFDLPSWQDSLRRNGQSASPKIRYNLSNWDQRARVFFHEATHLDWYMNAGENSDQNPLVYDLRIEVKKKGKIENVLAYGVENAKVLAKWRSSDPEKLSGYFTQRNGKTPTDNFAWFALGNKAGNVMSHYPNIPTIRRKPLKEPTDRDGNEPALSCTIGSDGFPDFIGPDLSNKEGQCPDFNRTGQATRPSVTVDAIYSEEDYLPANNEQRSAYDAALYDRAIISTALRILPLGDSITYGSSSNDGNGYRDHLYRSLVNGGNPVDFVGTVQAGTMADNDNEGHVGATIDEIAAYAQNTVTQPNVVLLHAGTVDMKKGLDLSNAPSRLGNLIDTLLGLYPGVLVLVAQIIPSLDEATNSNIISFNAVIPGLVASRTATGAKVMVVDMFGYSVGYQDFADNWTPNYNGYEQMAQAWYQAISYANTEMGYVSTPTTPVTPPAGTGGQQLAIASYINPLGDPAAWNRLIGYPENKVSVLIANVVNGPDSTADSDWASVIKKCAASGKTVLGYVRTGYLGVSQQQFTTRLGSTNLADWVSQIEQDVNMWYNLYPKIGGIFFDEGWNDCGPDNVYSRLYQYITQNTKRQYPGAFTVLNPGATMPQCFEDSADTLMTFEGSYETYLNNYVPNDWIPADSRKIWHIIYNVPAGQGPAVAALALRLGAGLIEITDDVLSNPYDNLPDNTYMQQLIDAVSGGTPLNMGFVPTTGGGPVTTPGGLVVVSFEYTSVTLSWSPSTNAVGYRIYMNNKQVHELALTAAMTKVTVGGLDPGTTGYTFQVTAMSGNGLESARSNSVTSATLATPLGNGKNVFNVHAIISATSTTYQADIVVPYAFTRIYIWGKTNGIYYCDNAAWTINYNRLNYVCAYYLVEGSTLFSYDSVYDSQWAWKVVGEVPVTRNGYTYTWTIPMGTSTFNGMDTSNFVIQTQGYGPAINAFQPCLNDGGGVDGDGRYCV